MDMHLDFAAVFQAVGVALFGAVAWWGRRHLESEDARRKERDKHLDTSIASIVSTVTDLAHEVRAMRMETGAKFDAAAAKMESHDREHGLHRQSIASIGKRVGTNETSIAVLADRVGTRPPTARIAEVAK